MKDCRYTTYGVSIPAVLSLVIELELILSFHRSVVRGSAIRTDIIGSNVRTATLTSIDSSFRTRAGHVQHSAISFQVHCETQKEVDYYWEKLSEGGYEEAQQSGWLKDK